MELTELALLAVVAVAAGAVNGAVGSGSLITLPALLSLGFSPASALVTNTIGILFSAVGGTLRYRKDLAAEGTALRALMVMSGLGAAVGASALLVSPPGALQVVVPFLIVLAILLVVLQPVIVRALSRRRERRAALGETRPGADRGPYGSRGLQASMFGASIYGGYFTAAQGILYMGVLGSFTGRPLAEVNGPKNLLSSIVNLVAALFYTVAFFLGHADVVWVASAAIGLGAVVGGYLGADIAKRLPSVVLRGIIVVVALIALVRELL